MNDIQTKLSQATSVFDALRLVLEQSPSFHGAFKIAANGTSGAISFSEGQITAAYTSAGARGKDAVDQLLALNGCRLQFSQPDQSQIPDCDRVCMSISEIVFPRTKVRKKVAVADKQAFLNQLEAEDEKHEFELREGKLSLDESLLTEYERAALEVMKNVTDDVIFNEQDPEFGNKGLRLTKQQIAVLSTAIRDPKSFEEVELRLDHDVPSLTLQQKELLELVSQSLRDRQQFEERDVRLAVDGLELTDYQLLTLGAALLARTPEEQKEEFHSHDERMSYSEENAVLLDFVIPGEIQPELSIDEADLHAIPTPKVHAADFRSLIPDEPDSILLPETHPLAAFIRNVGNTARHPIATYERLQREYPRVPFKLIGAAAGLLIVSLACFTIPGLLHPQSHGTLTPQEQNALLIREHEEDARAWAPATPPKRETPMTAAQGTISGGAGAPDAKPAVEPTPAVVPTGDVLQQARQFAAQSRAQDAATYYESYLRDNKRDVKARIELIKLYLSMKEQYKARQHCIRALKYQPPAEDQKQLMYLMQIS
jgi:hypothetical protein